MGAPPPGGGQPDYSQNFPATNPFPSVGVAAPPATGAQGMMPQHMMPPQPGVPMAMMPPVGMGQPMAPTGTFPHSIPAQQPMGMGQPMMGGFPQPAPAGQFGAPPVGQPAANPFMVPQPLPQAAAAMPAPQPLQPAGAQTQQQVAPIFDVSLLDTAAAPQIVPAAELDDTFSGLTMGPPASEPAADDDDADDAEEEEEDVGAPPTEHHLSIDAPAPTESAKKPETVLSRQDTWMYLENLQSSDWTKRTEAARALKSLAFNADAEYKEGLIKGGVCRLLIRMLSSAPTNAAVEQATSCMYSLAREHLTSKQELVKVGALRQLAALLNHESKQCRLNATATLYAVSCAGRPTCRELAQFDPIPALKASITPALGRNAQDEQLQLFAALLLVNLLHVRGTAKSKQDRSSLEACLTRAYEDATEEQVRETINIGLRRIHTLNSRKERMKAGVAKRVSRSMSRLSGMTGKSGGPAHPPSDLSCRASQSGGGAAPNMGGMAGSAGGAMMTGFGNTSDGRPASGRSYSKSIASSVMSSVKAGVKTRRGSNAHKSMSSDAADWQDE